MPEPRVNLLNISREEFKRGYMDALLWLINQKSLDECNSYYMIRFPDYSNLLEENINLTCLNMSCTSIYHYWYCINTFNGKDNLLYNYEDIITQVRDYLDYPEMRTNELNHLKYCFREIVELVADDFKRYVINFRPHELNVYI